MNKKKSLKQLSLLMKYLGFSPLSILLYLTLWEYGSITPSKLIVIVKKPRATVYRHLEKLISNGLIHYTIVSSERKLTAESPIKVQLLLNNKELTIDKELSKIKSFKNSFTNITSFLHDLADIKSVETNVVDVKVFSGKSQVYLVYKDIMKANVIYSFSDLRKYYTIYPNTRSLWYKSYELNPQRQMLDLIVDTPFARKLVNTSPKRYRYKFLPISEHFENLNFVDYIIFDDNVAVIQLDKDNILATVIKAKHIAHSLRFLHMLMWQLIDD